jgi:hypothetical protein
MKVRYRLEDLGVDERKILKYFFKETGFKGVDWIQLVLDSGKCCALDPAMTLLFQKIFNQLLKKGSSPWS